MDAPNVQEEANGQNDDVVNDGCNQHDDEEKENASTTSSSATASTSKGPGSKFYKTTLCQFYLAGPCKNGDDCNFAHGTSELRTQEGTSVKEAADKTSKLKSRLGFGQTG